MSVSSSERFRSSGEYQISKQVAGGQATDYDLTASGLWKTVEPPRGIPHLGIYQNLAAPLLSHNWRIVAETSAHRDPAEIVQARKLLVVRTDIPFNFESPLVSIINPRGPGLRVNLSPDEPSFEYHRRQTYDRNDPVSRITDVSGRRFRRYPHNTIHGPHTSDPNRYLIEITYANLNAAITDEQQMGLWQRESTAATAAAAIPPQGESIVPDVVGVGLDVAEEVTWQIAANPGAAEAVGDACGSCCQIACEIVGAALGGSN